MAWILNLALRDEAGGLLFPEGKLASTIVKGAYQCVASHEEEFFAAGIEPVLGPQGQGVGFDADDGRVIYGSDVFRVEGLFESRRKRFVPTAIPFPQGDLFEHLVALLRHHLRTELRKRDSEVHADALRVGGLERVCGEYFGECVEMVTRVHWSRAVALRAMKKVWHQMNSVNKKLKCQTDRGPAWLCAAAERAFVLGLRLLNVRVWDLPSRKDTYSELRYYADEVRSHAERLTEEDSIRANIFRQAAEFLVSASPTEARSFLPDDIRFVVSGSVSKDAILDLKLAELFVGLHRFRFNESCLPIALIGSPAAIASDAPALLADALLTDGHGPAIVSPATLQPGWTMDDWVRAASLVSRRAAVLLFDHGNRDAKIDGSNSWEWRFPKELDWGRELRRRGKRPVLIARPGDMNPQEFLQARQGGWDIWPWFRGDASEAASMAEYLSGGYRASANAA